MKREILLKVLEITKLQTISLEKDDMDEWGNLMKQKQICIDKLEEMQKENPEIKLQKEEELLKEIISIDSNNKKEFYRQFEEVQQNLKKIRSQKRVGNVYSNPYDVSEEEGVFFDKR